MSPDGDRAVLQVQATPNDEPSGLGGREGGFAYHERAKPFERVAAGNARHDGGAIGRCRQRPERVREAHGKLERTH